MKNSELCGYSLVRIICDIAYNIHELSLIFNLKRKIVKTVEVNIE